MWKAVCECGWQADYDYKDMAQRVIQRHARTCDLWVELTPDAGCMVS